MTAPEILVIILSIFLAIFLVIAIVLGALLIKVTLQIKRVTQTAAKAAKNAEAFTANMSKVTSQFYIGKYVMDFLRKVSNEKK